MGEIQAQQRTEPGLKKAAEDHMKNGRYGEAIDLLNKYVSANPRLPDGYNLRGLCFEARSEFDKAVLEFRRASKLDQKNAEYKRNLDRVMDVWYAALYKKIKGHQREIAINPSIPWNYLEIGKSYRWLEQWANAEEWYDKYLERDPNASPDEIIRYTEILAKTGSLVKGEKKLKEYVERYPDDWRLWSRYGYFTLWLGKSKIAEDAFLKALAIKPFFKEAEDGLDLARREAYVTQYQGKAFEKAFEYPIDRYYRLLKSNPDDSETRYTLIDELISADRLEEAYQQLQVLAGKHKGEGRFEEKWQYVTTYRTDLYAQRIGDYTSKIAADPYDKEAVRLLSQHYEYLQDYSNSFQVIADYFKLVPDEPDPKIRFQYARAAAWNRDFDFAIELMDKLIDDYPDNIDYQLFRAQLSIWNTRDAELATKYIENYLAQKPDNLEALISMGALKLIYNDYLAAQEYVDKARKIDPSNEEIEKLQSNIDFQKLRADEEKLYSILEDGRVLVLSGDCKSALPFYEDYLSKAEPNVIIRKEYGDVLFCAKEYQPAIDAYREAMAPGEYYDAQLQLAKVYYSMGDSISAVTEFKDLVNKYPEDFESRLYLGDSYAKLGDNDSARVVYNTLLNWPLDSTQTAMVKMRKKWLPITSLSAVLETFPNYVGLSPAFAFYSDNISFRFTRIGSGIETGVLQFLSFGLSFFRSSLSASAASLDEDILDDIPFTGRLDLTTVKGHVFLRLSRYLSTGVGIGSVQSAGIPSINETDFYMKYEKNESLWVQGSFLKTDAALILYSPYLIDLRLSASFFKVEGEYLHEKSKLKLRGYYHYIKITDTNAGNDVRMRLSKRFEDYISGGYEYFFSNYRFDSPYYYSPTNLETHSLFADVDLEESDEFKINLGIKLGYIPSNDFLMRELVGDIKYNFNDTITIRGLITVGSTSRDDISYNYSSGVVSAYISF
ncbi:MAG: tetratricopeptide repeat protein [bacterium]